MSTGHGWRVVGGVPPDALGEARRTLHHAAQIASLPGRWLLPRQPDDAHTALEWIDGRLCGAPVEGWRVALEPARLGLVVLHEGRVEQRYDLDGRTPVEARHWARERLAVAGIDVHPLRDEVPYELPPFPDTGGAAFRKPPGGALEEVGRYLSNGDRVCRALASGEPGVPPVRCWPHHFDVGTLLAAVPGGSTAERSVGIGLSPGDEAIPEPYFYVNLWPVPAAARQPPLPPGARWNTEGWTGAVLPATVLVATTDSTEQERVAVGFLEHAIGVAREMLMPQD